MPHDITLPIWPSITNCLAWSQDCELAVAAESHVELLIPKLNLSKLDLRNSYDSLWTTLHLRVDQFTEDEVQTQEPLSFTNFSIGEEISNGSVVALAWSPQGLAKHKRSVLAVLTSNLVLSIWAPNTDPSKLSEWKRVLVINRALDSLFQFNGSSNGVNDDKSLEIAKRKQRVRAFAWSSPLPNEYQQQPKYLRGRFAPTWLAVSNDCNEINIIRTDYHRVDDTIQGNRLVTTVVATFSTNSFDHNDPLTLSDTFEDCMSKSKFISHLAWSPWSFDSNVMSGTNVQPRLTSFIAYATSSKLALRRVHYDSELQVNPSDLFELSSLLSPIGQLRWFPRLDFHLFATFPGEIRRYSMSLVDPTDVSIHVDPLEGWDEVSGLGPGNCHEVSAVLYYARLTTLSTLTGLPPFVNVSGHVQDPQEKNNRHERSWLKKVFQQREDFGAANRLDGHVSTKVWGLASSPLGNLIAAISTQHPADIPEYVIPADYRSTLSISNSLDDETFQLPVYGGFITHWKDPTSETMAFSLLHWLNAHKELSWEDSSVHEHLVQTVEAAFTPLPDNEEPEVNINDVSFESEDWEPAAIEYLRQNLYNAKHARSRLCERIVSLLDPSGIPSAIDDGNTTLELSSVVVKLPPGLDRSKISRKIRALHNEAYRLLGGSQPLNSTDGNHEDLVEYCGICKSNVRLPFEETRYTIGTCGHHFGKLAGMRVISR
jgi:hypothetical protein